MIGLVGSVWGCFVFCFVNCALLYAHLAQKVKNKSAPLESGTVVWAVLSEVSALLYTLA